MDGVHFFFVWKVQSGSFRRILAKQRKKGGCNENPTAEQFAQQEVLVNVMNSDLVTSLRGNTKGRI